MTDAAKVLVYIFQNTIKGKENYADVELLGQEPLKSMSLDEINNAIEVLSSEGIIYIAKNIASTFSLTSCDPSIIAEYLIKLQRKQNHICF